MPVTRRRGTTALIAIASLVAALVSPLVASSSAQAADVSGLTLGVNANTWVDTTLESVMKRGEFYSSSVRGPANIAPYTDLSSSGLPAGLSASLDSTNGVVTLSGTPTTPASGINFYLQFYASNGGPYYIRFEGFVVDANLTATTTAASAPEFAAYTAVALSAAVTGSAPTGTVTFRLGGTVVATAPVDSSGIASWTGSVSTAFIGTSPALTATYAGDSANSASVSTTSPTVYIYATTTVSGTVSSNGAPVPGEVRLLSGESIVTSHVAADTGAFSLTVPAPTSLAEATALYSIYAVETGTYYSSAAGPGHANATDGSAATATGFADWSAPKNIYLNVAPVWVDSTLATPRLHSAYSDGVSASGTTPITYSVTDGHLPDWLTLDPATGALTAVYPTDQSAYSFVLGASNPYASIVKSFSFTPLDAGVAPIFTDDALATPQVGAEYSDSVTASGDPTIVYSSMDLPPGLTLDSSTGAISGTPTTAATRTVTVTATNEFGSTSFDWIAVVFAAPAIDLILDFQAGDEAAEAAVHATAEGLAPGSAVTIDVFSEPIRAYEGVVDASGTFDLRAAIPAATAVGSHHVVATAVALDGSLLSASAWFSVLPDGTIGGVSYTGPVALPIPVAVPLAVEQALAATGTDALGMTLSAVVLLALGFAMVARKRRSELAPPVRLRLMS